MQETVKFGARAVVFFALLLLFGIVRYSLSGMTPAGSSSVLLVAFGKSVGD